jgi:hypothetical protein
VCGWVYCSGMERVHLRLFKIFSIGICLFVAGCGPTLIAVDVASKVLVAATDQSTSTPSMVRSVRPLSSAELSRDDRYICSMAVENSGGRLVWSAKANRSDYVNEARARQLNCTDPSSLPQAGVVSRRNSLAINQSVATRREAKGASNNVSRASTMNNAQLCGAAVLQGNWDTRPTYLPFVEEAKRRGLDCRIADTQSTRTAQTSNRIDRNGLASVTDTDICIRATLNGQWDTRPSFAESVREAKRRGLDCIASKSDSSAKSIDAAEVRALKERLARLEAEKDSKQQAISQDTQSPSIRITASNSDGARGTISGIATDNTGIAEVLIDGEAVVVDSGGRFTTSTFIPSGGVDVQITAYDLKGLSITETVRLERSKRTQTVSRLAAVNPLVGPKQKPSRDRAALIIGVETYASAPSADFASRDAQMFADYAREKLGIPDNNIKVLTDTEATETEVLRALKVWLPKAVKPDTTDLYVFYAGHGMPTADGTSAYLVPYDGDIQLLEDTAISRKRFFDEISATKPRSATFFFDNCYSGATRSEQQLLAARPLTIKVEETDVPDNYLVFAAGETDQIAGVEPEVKHGRFSYFVFKGLEGEADANRDGKISAGELHTFVRESVGRFSAGAQTPTMLGDAGRWVLR